MRYWKRIDGTGKTTTVESYSHDLDIKGATKITEKEYDDYIASLPPRPPLLLRDLTAEVDALSARVDKLEKK